VKWYVTYWQRHSNRRRRRRVWKEDPGVFRAAIVSERETDKAKELTVKGEYRENGKVKVDLARVRVPKDATFLLVERM